MSRLLMDPRSSKPLILHAVGDIGIVGRLAAGLAERPPLFPFHRVADSLAAADIVFGNLEIPFSGGARISAHESKNLQTPEAAGTRLAAAGFHILSLANNHAMDFGAAGLEATRRLLAAQGIATVGAGSNLAEARHPVVLERRGHRVGFLAYCTPFRGSAAPDRPGAAPLRIEVVREDVGALAAQVDYVVVSAHFGMMYLEHPTPEDMDLARSILEAGANLIVGHHPHVLQGIEEARGGLIAYSLGEFAFDPEAGNYYARVARETRRRSLIFRAEMGNGRVRLLPPIPTAADESLCPYPLEGDAAAQALRSLDRLSRTLHDPQARRAFWDYAGGQLFGYEMSGLWFSIRHGSILHLLSSLPRIRTRHLKLVLGYLRSALFGKRGTFSSP